MQWIYIRKHIYRDAFYWKKSLFIHICIFVGLDLYWEIFLLGCFFIATNVHWSAALLLCIVIGKKTTRCLKFQSQLRFIYRKLNLIYEIHITKYIQQIYLDRKYLVFFKWHMCCRCLGFIFSETQDHKTANMCIVLQLPK